MKKSNSPYPDWVLKHRKPKTEIRLIRGKFYVYEVSSTYDKEKKRARKVSGKYLGRITELEGFVPSDKIKVSKKLKLVNETTLSTKEYGLSAFIQKYCSNIIDILKIYFPDQWEWMLVCLYARLVHSSPIKNITYYYNRSYLSETLDISVNTNRLRDLLKDLGKNRQPMIDFMKSFMGSSVALIDATSIVSHSKNLVRNHLGKTKVGSYEPLFNLLYFYHPSSYTPAYYRLFDGNIKDVKMIQAAIEESGYNDALVIADKGFYSEENIKILEEASLRYIIPLKRNSTFIKSELFGNLPKGRQKFMFAERLVYYTSYDLTPKTKGRPKKAPVAKKRILLFIDEAMMIKEKKDFYARMQKHPQNYTEDDFQEKMNDFGSFAVITNIQEDEETIYKYYKSRIGVEVLFDGVKNILGNDKTYMQNNDTLEGWMFINHLALQVHHRIYDLLKTHNMLSEKSIRDFIEYLSDIRIIKVNEQWIMEPMVNEQKKLLKKLGLHIT